MDIAPFALERWFARYEHRADIMLAESGIRSLPAARFDLDPGDLGYVIPTGRYHDWATVGAIYDLAVDADAYLLCDEVYRGLAPDPHPPVASLDRGLSTTSLSKAIGLAGIRFGWLAGPAAVVESAWGWKDYTTISPTRIGQHVARQALDREAELRAESRAIVDRNRARVAAFLDDYALEWLSPVGVNGFVTIPGGFPDATAFCRAVVEEESVVLAPGTAFGYDRYFRIGFGLPTDRLSAGLDRLGRFLDRHA